MISKTTEKDEHGWYYTFRMRKDGTVIIQQKNNSDNVQEKHNEIHIYGNGVLGILNEVINSKTQANPKKDLSYNKGYEVNQK